MGLRFRPSIIDELLSKLPEDLQIKALNAIIQEHDRWECGNLTDEERTSLELVSKLAENAGQTFDKIIIDTLKMFGKTLPKKSKAASEQIS